MVDGWDMVQRPAVWHPDASAAEPRAGVPPLPAAPAEPPGRRAQLGARMFTDRFAVLPYLGAVRACCNDRQP